MSIRKIFNKYCLFEPNPIRTETRKLSLNGYMAIVGEDLIRRKERIGQRLLLCRSTRHDGTLTIHCPYGN